MQLCTEQIPNVLHIGDPNRANKLLVSLTLWTRQTQLIKLRLPKRYAHTLYTKCSFGRGGGGGGGRRKKGQSTLIWSYSGSILSHAQEYLKPTVSLNSPLYQLQYYILMINSVKNYFHSFWTILCTEYFRNEYFIFSTWISARFVHC